MQSYPPHRSLQGKWPLITVGGLIFYISLSLIHGVTRFMKPPVALYSLQRTPIDDLIPEDQYRVALVMPCSFIETVTSLPLTLNSIINSSEPYEESTVVFGIRHDLESALDDIFPMNLAHDIDRARDMLRHFILTWARDTPENEQAMKRSKPLDFLTTGDSMTPRDYLNAFHVVDYLADDRRPYHQYLKNIIRVYEGFPTLDEMARKIPNFSIILNRDDYPYANANRQKGVFSAFGDTTDIRRNDIISFVDCDDMVSPPRRHVIEQVFRENPEIVEFGNGSAAMDLSREYDDMHPDREKQDAKNREILDPQPREIDTPEFRDQIYSKCFDFRDEKIKKLYHDNHAKREFLVDNNGDYLDDPWNIKKHYLSDKVNFTWWLGSTGYNSPTDQKMGYQVSNGHTTWRQDWLVNHMVHLPNSVKGEDARMTYYSVQLGGKFLATECPLTTYVFPSGDAKRSAIEKLTEFIREKFKEHEVPEVPASDT